MRLQRETMTIPVGQSVSNGIHIETEKVVGIRIIEDSDAQVIAIQCLVAGHLGDDASQIWDDVFGTETDNPPGADAGFSASRVALNATEVTDETVIMFAHPFYTPLPVVRLVNRATAGGALTNITGTPFTARLITDTHD